MPSRSQFVHEDVAMVPRGYHVRTITHPSGAEVRVAFPPGPRKRGAGRLVSILYPKGHNPQGLHLSLCTDPDFSTQLNPTSLSYLKAAERAAKSGDYIKTKKLLGKAMTRKRKELVRPVRKSARNARKGYPKVSTYPMATGTGKPIREDGKTVHFTERLSKAQAIRQAQDLRAKGYSENPNGDAAAQAYKDFHGRAPHQVVELQESIVKAGDYTALGDNPELWLKPLKGAPERWPAADIEFEPQDGVKLAADAGGHQLYFIGGNQRLPLGYLKEFDTSKRFIALGTVYGISYLTEKVFDGYKSTTYAHEFGEETGERPQLFYDKDNARLILAGGAYSIAPVDKGLRASPGIVN